MGSYRVSFDQEGDACDRVAGVGFRESRGLLASWAGTSERMVARS